MRRRRRWSPPRDQDASRPRPDPRAGPRPRRGAGLPDPRGQRDRDRPQHRAGAAVEERRRAAAARLHVQADVAEHGVRGAEGRAPVARYRAAGLADGGGLWRLHDVPGPARPRHRRGSDPRRGRAVGQRRHRGAGRGAQPRRDRGRLRAADDRPRPRAGHDEFGLPQLERLAGAGARDVDGRPGDPGRAAHHRVPRILPLLRRDRVRLRRPRAVEPAQPQPAPAAGHRRGRAEDRPHAGGGLRAGGLGGAGRPARDLRDLGARQRAGTGRGIRAHRQLGLPAIRRDDAVRGPRRGGAGRRLHGRGAAGRPGARRGADRAAAAHRLGRADGRDHL